MVQIPIPTDELAPDEGKMKVFNPDRHRKDTSPVQVHIRLKQTDDETAVYNIHAKNRLLHSPNDGRVEPDKWLVFDHIHSPTATNEDVYKKSGFDCVENALQGFNTAVFAYGQQGSGKTRTLMSKDGITAYTVSHLFNRLAKDDSQKFVISCSYLQIYNERIYDLLNPDNEFECTVREHKTRGLYVENMTRVPCKTPKDVYELINIGRRSLVLAETKLNQRSSRSHAICQLQIEYADKTNRKKSSSLLNAFASRNRDDDNNEAYIDFDTVPFQRKNIKRSHSIAITKLHERNIAAKRFHQSGNCPDSEKSDKNGRYSNISHRKGERQNTFIKKSHSFRNDRLPSYSKRFQERRYFNMSTMSDVKLYQGKEFDRIEQKEMVSGDIGLPPTGIPTPLRYPSLFHAAIEPAADRNSQSHDRKRPIRVQIPRLIRKSRDETSQSEEDISDVTSSEFYNKFQTSEHFGSEYLDLANHDETRLYDAERLLKNKNSMYQQNHVCSKISIVDLAGSERVKKSHVSGERLKEAQHINLSLLELGNVISALADGKKKHVPYRNSILTRLLQDTLGGNSKLTFLLCVSTKLCDVSETKCTLEFGQKLKKILTTPSINVDYYKWKYENAIDDQKRKQEQKARQEERRLNIENQYNTDDTDQIEYNNVIGQYDQSKTLIDMLQYMMGLNGIRPINEPESDSVLTDLDTGMETDDTLTEASDLDADFNEDDSGFDSTSNLLASHNMAFSDLSLNSSLLHDGEVEELPFEENSVDFDLFEIPEPVTIEDLGESEVNESENNGDENDVQHSSFDINERKNDGDEEDENDAQKSSFEIDGRENNDGEVEDDNDAHNSSFEIIEDSDVETEKLDVDEEMEILSVGEEIEQLGAYEETKKSNVDREVNKSKVEDVKGLLEVEHRLAVNEPSEKSSTEAEEVRIDCNEGEEKFGASEEINKQGVYEDDSKIENNDFEEEIDEEDINENVVEDDDDESTTEDEGFVTQYVEKITDAEINSQSLEKYLADEAGCFNDDEPPLMTSSPNCTNEEASFSSDEMESLTDNSSLSDTESNRDLLDETADFKHDQDDVYLSANSDIDDVSEKNKMIRELMTSQELRVDTESVTSELSDVTDVSLSNPASPNGEDRRLINARKLEALRARLRGVRDTQHLHHVRNGCWCQRKQHV